MKPSLSLSRHMSNEPYPTSHKKGCVEEDGLAANVLWSFRDRITQCI